MVKLKLEPKLDAILSVIVVFSKLGVSVSFDGNIAPTNTLPDEPDTAIPINSLVPLAYVYPPPANTLHTVTDPAFLKLR